ncbi:hypothetical protein OHS18_01100 [Amycolatopsis sp. NBC_00355]|uniref:hypothetical protein n=1 Tax=Amycolatopsis sp. NBC_00355 TaxID=2975957 RepID=UPI002E260E5C
MLTETGTLLRSDVEGTMAALALRYGGPFYRSFAELTRVVDLPAARVVVDVAAGNGALLSRVLHDWDDERCHTILTTTTARCRPVRVSS